MLSTEEKNSNINAGEQVKLIRAATFNN